MMAAAKVEDTTRVFILQNYRPIDYSAPGEFGNGSRVVNDLPSTAAKLYEILKDRQDHRDDYGHTDTVIALTLKLADLMNLSPQHREAALIAAIVHDSGWDVFDNIKTVWQDLMRKYHGAEEGSPERKEIENKVSGMRQPHQDRAVELLREHLPNYHLLEEVCLVVGDHDTRLKKSEYEPYLHAFLDADFLARLTVTCLYSGGANEETNSNPERVFKKLKESCNPSSYLSVHGPVIARIELAATMLRMERKMSWSKLPDDFTREYREEIALLSKV